MSNFGTWIRAYIGPEGAAGFESFDIRVSTPDWLISQIHS
ncbi:immunity 8 family protein [Burkholderia sp. BKH01]|nr:immunity 8 family protein [Burkholderia sp. BKH01]MCU9954648.1 immunity 8 family protein [Burkholderia sp. BKH01]